ncbi:MAG: putative ribose-phosphate pyrophosphokinase [Chlamydiae bacterium]|nr:putative ribose-phosphate pyrophosphokinase [Chlamydiota bacterium]
MSKWSFCIIMLALLSIGDLKATTTNKEVNINKVDEILKTADCLVGQEGLEIAFNKMALEMNQELKDKNPLLICVLKGAIYTFGQLMTRLDFPLEVDYIHATRYSKNQGQKLKWIARPQKSLEGRVVVLVDDIIDEGITLSNLIEFCKNEGALEVYSAVLVDKNRTRAETGLLNADFVGLKIPNKFIIGAGLDFEGYFRNMPGIYVMPSDASILCI